MSRSETFKFRVTQTMFDQAHAEAARRGITVSDLIRGALGFEQVGRPRRVRPMSWWRRAWAWLVPE